MLNRLIQLPLGKEKGTASFQPTGKEAAFGNAVCAGCLPKVRTLGQRGSIKMGTPFWKTDTIHVGAIIRWGSLSRHIFPATFVAGREENKRCFVRNMQLLSPFHQTIRFKISDLWFLICESRCLAGVLCLRFKKQFKPQPYSGEWRRWNMPLFFLLIAYFINWRRGKETHRAR